MGSENVDQGFNDSELADIMQEIEGLEAMAAADDNEDEEMIDAVLDDVEATTPVPPVPPVPASAPIPHPTPLILKEEEKSVDVDEEIESAKQMEQNLEDEYQERQKEFEKNTLKKEVVTMKKDQAPISPTRTTPEDGVGYSQMNFQIQGNMVMDLGFTVAGKTIRINVGEEHGLELFLPGGMKFSIPFD